MSLFSSVFRFPHWGVSNEVNIVVFRIFFQDVFVEKNVAVQGVRVYTSSRPNNPIIGKKNP
jgi:hypothetical protein